MITALVVLLAFVDVAALLIGISIRRKVVHIIDETAANIEVAVKAGIADAATKLLALASSVLLPGDPRHEQIEHAAELVRGLREPG